MHEEFHVSSLIVHGKPDSVPAISSAIEDLPGAEIHAATEQGKIIVTLETENDATMLSLIQEINEIEGVLSAALVFHQVEDAHAQK